MSYQCPNSQILCSKCRKSFRLNHNRTTCRVCDATEYLECTALNCIEKTPETKFMTVKMLHPAGNDNYAEFRHTASTTPAGNDDYAEFRPTASTTPAGNNNYAEFRPTTSTTPAGNDDYAEFRPTTSTTPARNEDFLDTHHRSEPTHLHLF